MRLPSDVPNEGCGERPPLIPPSDVPLFPAFQMQHHPDDAGDQADDDAYGETLDAFINTEQQSYDEFLQNFVHLTAHDVPSASSLYNDSDFGEDLPNPVIPAQPGNHQLFTIEDIYIPPLLGSSEEATYILPPPVTGPEHLEEEILGEGSRAPDILIRSTDSGIVRVDNFVEIEDEDDDLGIGSYQASFGSPQKTEEQPNEEAISKVCDNNKADDSPEEDTDGIDTESSAIVENDPVQKSGRKIKHEILEGTDTNENNANNEKLKIEELTEKEKERQNEELRLDRERILSIKSSSNEKELTSKESDNLLDLVMENSESDTESDLEYDPALDKPNFGEVEDEQPVVAEKDVENIRNLDFSAKCGVPNNIRPAVIRPAVIDTNETEKQKVQEEVKATGEEEPVIIDNVEPFKLDDDFDYDNVILTPKFTAEEVRYLNSFLPSNQGAGSAK